MTSELSVFQVEAELRKQVRDILEPMMEQHERGQERVKGAIGRVEGVEERVEMLERAVYQRTTEGVTVFDRIRDQFLEVEANRQGDAMKVAQ